MTNVHDSVSTELNSCLTMFSSSKYHKWFTI